MPSELPLAAITFAAMIFVTVGLINGVRRLPGARKLKSTNDIVGFYTTIIGTIYAVILAFMLFAVWTRYQDAEDTVDKEASAVTDMFQLAGGVSDPAQSQIRALLRDYAVSAIRQEWPAMQYQRESERVTEDRNAIWRILTHFEARTPREQTIMDQMLTRLLDMNAQRRRRLLTSRTGLPPILWIVLIAGGFITVGASALFGVEQRSLHVCKALILAGIIYLVLYAVWLINGPFTGSVHVGSGAFKMALSAMQHIMIASR